MKNFKKLRKKCDQRPQENVIPSYQTTTTMTIDERKEKNNSPISVFLSPSYT